jgi:hypothetical protein
MDKKLLFILAFLLLLCVSSFVAGVYLNSPFAFALSGAALLPFVLIFAVGILDYKVGGTHLTLEKRVNHLEQESKELRDSVTALLKSIYVMSHGASILGGPTDYHRQLLSEYLHPVNHLVAPGTQDQVNDDIAKLMTKLRAEEKT